MTWLTAAHRVPKAQFKRHITNVYGRELRVYPCPLPESDELVLLPGATSILSATAPPKDNETLERWRLKEIAAGRDPKEGANRGSIVHALLEHRVRGMRLPSEVKVEDTVHTVTDRHMAFYNGMWEHIKDFDHFVWNEEPLMYGDRWGHVWSTPDRDDPDCLARVWSTAWGFAGTPDLLSFCKQRSGHVLSDFKTSKEPYYQPVGGSPVPSGCGYGFKKYKKTVRQLCLYDLAIQETLGLEVCDYQIVVGTPTGTQSLWVPAYERRQEMETAKRLCMRFWEEAARSQSQARELAVA